MKSNPWNLPWCRQETGYKIWLPSMGQSTSLEIKKETPGEYTQPEKSLTSTCFNCGAISFMPGEKCDICKKKFREQKAAPEPTLKKSLKVVKRRKMSFDEFEANKLKLNRLKEKWCKAVIKRPLPSQLKRLETKINQLQTGLKNNIYPAFLFQPGRG